LCLGSTFRDRGKLGGAMLEFLAKGTLPGIAALRGEPRLWREALKKK